MSEKNIYVVPDANENLCADAKRAVDLVLKRFDELCDIENPSNAMDFVEEVVDRLNVFLELNRNNSRWVDVGEISAPCAEEKEAPLTDNTVAPVLRFETGIGETPCVMVDDRYCIYLDNGVVYDTEEAMDVPPYVFEIRDDLMDNRVKDLFEPQEGRNRFNLAQTNELLIGLEHGLSYEQLKVYAQPFFRRPQMEIIRMGLEDGLSVEQVSVYAQPCFFSKQMNEMYLGFAAGLSAQQVALYANCDLLPHQMAVMRQMLVCREKAHEPLDAAINAADSLKEPLRERMSLKDIGR